MTKEEKKQLLIEFQKWQLTHMPINEFRQVEKTVDRFISATTKVSILPDEGEKSAEEKAFEAGRMLSNPPELNYTIHKFKTFNDYKTQTP